MKSIIAQLGTTEIPLVRAGIRPPPVGGGASGGAWGGGLPRRYRLDPSQIVAVYDELDLPVGRVRVRPGGGPGGQGGMKSIIAQLGTRDFPRVRIGIGRPLVGGEPSWDPEAVAG